MALCVRECFACVELDNCDGKVECLWVRIRGKASKADVLLGICYRSPNQDEKTDEAFYRYWQKSTNCQPIGHFNLPYV